MSNVNNKREPAVMKSACSFGLSSAAQKSHLCSRLFALRVREMLHVNYLVRQSMVPIKKHGHHSNRLPNQTARQLAAVPAAGWHTVITCAAVPLCCKQSKPIHSLQKAFSLEKNKNQISVFILFLEGKKTK